MVTCLIRDCLYFTTTEDTEDAEGQSRSTSPSAARAKTGFNLRVLTVLGGSF